MLYHLPLQEIFSSSDNLLCCGTCWYGLHQRFHARNTEQLKRHFNACLRSRALSIRYGIKVARNTVFPSVIRGDGTGSKDCSGRATRNECTKRLRTRRDTHSRWPRELTKPTKDIALLSEQFLLPIGGVRLPQVDLLL